MAEEFKIIAITHPGKVKDETEKILTLLQDKKVDIVHLRKPGEDITFLRRILDQIPFELHPFIKIHDHFNLCEEYNLGGVHLNSRNPIAPPFIKNFSKSCHSLKELEDIDCYDYVTLSPIFDSISKQDYKSNFIPEEIKDKISGKRVVALGGITPDKIERLKDCGFYGAAMLGYFWN